MRLIAMLHTVRYWRAIVAFSASLCIAVGLLADSVLFGQEIVIVSPSEFSNVEGDGLSDELQCCPFSFRYQQIFPATDFSSLPGGQGLLTSIAWRPDGEAVTGPRSVNIGPSVVRLSTTNSATLDDNFDSNITSPAVEVLNREVVIETANLGPAGGPKEFDYVVQLDEPFLYDITKGNLLFDWDILEGFPAPAHLSDGFTESFDTAMGTVRFATPVESASGFFVGGFVQEFTFVPEPSSAALAAIGMLVPLCSRRRKRLSWV